MLSYLVTSNLEYDHFPVPKSCGGTVMVPTCISCHDMKDRFAPGQWPDEWTNRIIEDFPNMCRETKLFMGQFMRLYAMMIKKVKTKHTKKTLKTVKAQVTRSRKARNAL